MLSYRHAFHAGNHADVLKHLVEIALLRYLNQKNKPYWYIDTHAGAGVYSLDSEYASKNAEYESGIARLWERDDLPALVADYVDVVRRLNPDGTLKLYPGSPYCADQVLREDDKLRLFELHPTDSVHLIDNFRGRSKRALIKAEDGFAGIKAFLPPAPRRALTLIDPPYEDKRDYQRVVDMLKDSLERFATGTYAVWYPMLARKDSKELPEKLKKLPAKGWLHVALQVQSPAQDGFGMHGSGMFILNPPYTLHDELKVIMPWLTQVLAQDKGAKFILEQQAS
ncbi:23S rRNA (adenine(2030)-N(6))-methyltransferase RlmJ [Crenobacter sp. SG2303]|uniref:Ribosomal RNA large subunit methyltransferase J n=1 Tax=Crenobacter oryzisoli TaxID=3056844 RepID=A0ABT7XKA0_9NEIS|nr:23S rRNA (adenine(2030)-N(6))-methyltransferase RlmJ [Crenobacter sp. SG2303]MDN0074217.1 23S rRNA (adenine(2030)-N(6))-methyltransferase RlmJ [Crenobacter sp. SG2303]